MVHLFIAPGDSSIVELGNRLNIYVKTTIRSTLVYKHPSQNQERIRSILMNKLKIRHLKIGIGAPKVTRSHPGTHSRIKTQGHFINVVTSGHKVGFGS